MHIHRSLMNQMVSNVCRINICFTLLNAVVFLIVFSFESLPEPMCNIFVSSGRFLYSSSLSQLALRQWIRYAYIVNWKFMSSINDDFATLFLVLWSLLGCAIFVFIVYFFGNNNTEMNFHYCTGRNHIKSIQSAFQQLESSGNICPKSFCVKNLSIPGPLDYFTYIALTSLVLVSFLFWIDNHKHKLKVIWKKCISSSSPDSPTNNQMSSNKFDEQAKLFDLKAGQTIRILFIALLCSFPTMIARAFAHRHENNINSGPGRVWVYVTQISIVFFFFNFFPANIILSNPKMMKSLKTDFKETSIGGRIWSLFQRNQS